jgi:hypothetical protein
MQSYTKTLLAGAAFAFAVAGASAEPRVSMTFTPGAPAPVKAALPAAKPVKAAAAIAALKPSQPAAIAFAAPVARPVSAWEQRVRAQLKFATVKWGGKPVQTLDEASRLALVKAAADRAALHTVGLSYHDVYGLIEAETSWIPRTGSSKDGTPNLGLAQFEPRTARGLGIHDPEDPVQAVFGAAAHMKEAAQWAAAKIAGLKLSPEERSAKLREGVSIYYNLSIKGRNKWDGLNTAQLPVETQRHIRNTRAGAMEAAQLARLLKA